LFSKKTSGILNPGSFGDFVPAKTVNNVGINAYSTKKSMSIAHPHIDKIGLKQMTVEGSLDL